jgi:hypothetical protein
MGQKGRISDYRQRQRLSPLAGTLLQKVSRPVGLVVNSQVSKNLDLKGSGRKRDLLDAADNPASMAGKTAIKLCHSAGQYRKPEYRKPGKAETGPKYRTRASHQALSLRSLIQRIPDS